MRSDPEGRPTDERLQALDDLADRLRCPNCAGALSLASRALSCANGHSFDVAREGYVSLAPPRRRAAAGDSPEMVAAREAFLARGHYAPIAGALVAAARDTLAPGPAERAPLAVDLGAGTGYYLGALLEAQPQWRGVALDASRSALRRATRAHPRIAAVLCDVWQELPVRDACAQLVLNVFAPRNAAEIGRVLAPGGTFAVVTPSPSHLRELVDALGLLDVGADKQERLHAALAPRLQLVDARELELAMELDRDDVGALVAMGPSARHISAGELRARIASLPAKTSVGASIVIETFRASASAGETNSG